MKKRILTWLVCLICCLVPVCASCSCGDDETNVDVSVPRFDGMNISEESPLSDSEAAKNAKNGAKGIVTASDEVTEPTETPENIDVPEDDMPPQTDVPADIAKDVASELEKEVQIGADESNASVSYFAEVNQDVYLTISLINPNSYAILRFTLNGVVYQSYQFESGSTSTMLVLKVNSGSECGIKEFTLDEIKYVDDNDGNAIKDAIIEGNRSVKINVAYDKVPVVEVLSESMEYTKYSADFYVSDTYDLIDYKDGCRLYLYDGTTKLEEIKLQKGSNSISFDNLVMGKSYKCLVLGMFDRYDEAGFSAHVLFETEIRPSAFCAFTDVKSGYDSISFGYKILNSIAEVTDIILFNDSGDAIARPQDNAFSGLLADTTYQLRLYYTFKLESEELVFYDSFNVKTKAYPVPSVSATYSVRETSIDFDVHVDDDFGLLKLNSIKLYDQNGEFVASVSPDDKTIDGLSRNKNYVLKFLYTYDLKDGKGEVAAEKAIAFSTSKAVPVVEIKPYHATENSLNFELIVTDPNIVGRINSIRLYKKEGNVYVDALTNTALREFGSLEPNTAYIIEVGYIYDMDDGNGSQIITYSEEMTTAKRVPACELKTEVTTDSISVALEENDPDNAGELVSVSVYDGETLVKKVEEVSALMTFDGLYSDKEYTVVGEYKYNVDDYSQTDTTLKPTTTVKTYAKLAPQITVTESNGTYTSFDYAVTKEDTFGICSITNVKLMLGTVTVKETQELSGSFTGLYSNNKYTVEVYHSYDLNDGNGVHSEVYRKDIKTAKRDDIVLSYADMRALENSIKFGYEIVDKDNLMKITRIELFDANGTSVQSLSDLTLRVFENLAAESFYTLVTTFEYDLGDGKGLQSDSVSIKYGTSGSKLFVNSLEVLNNNSPSVGEEVHVRLSLDNPHGLDVSAIFISDVRCEVLNNSSDLSDVIVKFVPETEGGHFTVEVTGYEYVTAGVTLADDLTSEFKKDIIVMGELNIVDYFAISDSYYLNFSKSPMRILEIDNPTGYEIYSLSYIKNYNGDVVEIGETTNFTVIDENHLLIKEEGISLYDRDIWKKGFRRQLTLCGITYGIEDIRVPATFDYMECPVVLYNDTVHISTADDLLSITVGEDDYGSNYTTHYILDNDIDMKGVTWEGVRGKGVFDGQGHTINNLTIVIENEGTTAEFYGLFKAFTGVIHDVHLENIYYSVKTNGAARVAGISAANSIVYNSSVSGTIRVQTNDGYVAGIADGRLDGNYSGWHNVSTNNYVEDLQIFVTGNMQSSMLIYSNRETRFRAGDNNYTYDYTYSLGELNSMILGRSFIQNTETNAKTYPYYIGDNSGLGEMYVEKQLSNVEYSFVTNCDTVADFKMTGVSVTDIKVQREGYLVQWYDNAEFTGKEITLPYMAEENTTLYAKWTRMTVANPKYTYVETYPWNEETKSSFKAYMIRDFGEAEKTDKTFVIGGYYKGYPVIGVEENAFRFIRYKDVDGSPVERDWQEINEIVKEYSIYYTSTVYGNMIGQAYASDIYMESVPKTMQGNDFYLGFYGENITLNVAAGNSAYYQEKYGKDGRITIKTYTADSSPFKDVVIAAPTDEKNDRITVICADADNLKESTVRQLSELPYEYYEKDGYRWLDYSGTQFVIINNNLYAGIDRIAEDELFRYIVYANGDVTIGAFLARAATSVDLTALDYKVTAIADGVFRDTKIKNITLNEGLREIGVSAFENCSALTAIEFPSTLKSVGSRAFYNCSSLQRIIMNDGITRLEDSTFNNQRGSSSLKEVRWSANLKEIGSNAFGGYYSEMDFILPEGLEKISWNNFWNCNANVYIPLSVKVIESGGVNTHRNIFIEAQKKPSGWDTNWCNTDPNSGVKLHWNVKEIKSNEDYSYLVKNDGEITVLKCLNKDITSVSFDFEEGEVVEIVSNAFQYTGKISDVTLPDSLKVIGARAFISEGNGNVNLKYVLIPAGVEEIGEWAFSENTSLYSKANCESGGWDENIAARTKFGCIAVEQNDDFVYIRDINGVHIVGLVKNYTRQTVDLKVEGYTTLSVAGGLFSQNRLITEVIIPEGVEEIGNCAFENCYNLIKLVLPESLVKVGQRAFVNCNPYNLLYLSENLTEVGNEAFVGGFSVACAAAQRPEGWNERWYSYESEQTFEIVNNRLYWNIAEVHCDDAETYDYLVTNDGKVIIVGVNDTSITEINFEGFDGEVVEIGAMAFNECNALKVVILPESVTAVRYQAFDCWGIKFVYVPASVVSIGRSAFNYSTTVLTPVSEYLSGWDADVWNNMTKSVTSYEVEKTTNESNTVITTTVYYYVSGDSERKSVTFEQYI